MLRRVHCLLASVGALALAVTLPASAPNADEATASDDTVDSGIVERTGVRLMLLDVEATDKRGNPMPGLSRADFKVKLNGKRQPIYSLDDLCPVGEAQPAGEAVEASERVEAREVDGSPDLASIAVGSDPLLFVLYFEFSLLREEGRLNAIAQARAWVRDVMHDGDRVQVVAHASGVGLVRLTPFTSSRQELFAAIDRAKDDPRLVDTFARSLPHRVRDCLVNCCFERPCRHRLCCRHFARQELNHSRRALRTMQTYMESLEQIPGRKALILFHQNGTQFPARLYGLFNFEEFRVGDHVQLLERVAAEATLSRTSIFTAFVGNKLDPGAGRFVSMGANLASFTGGDYSRGVTDALRMSRGAGRGTNCVYRIGLTQPSKGGSGPQKVRVTVRNRPVRYRYRVRFLDEVDRWWRKARWVLSEPENSKDLVVAAALVPRSVSDDGWELALQVALDTETLASLPQGGAEQADWEVGALLTRAESSRTWQMLGVSRIRMAEDERAIVVHERLLEGLEAGTYRLGAFARDRVANAFGGAESTVLLPEPGRVAVVGPVMRQADRPHLVAPLPLLRKESAPQAAEGRSSVGAVPGQGDPVTGGPTLELSSWICPPEGATPSPGDVLRYVVRDGEPAFRFEAPRLEPAGFCYRLTDLVETGNLPPGRYAYHIRWSRAESTDVVEVQKEFTVPEPPPPPS